MEVSKAPTIDLSLLHSPDPETRAKALDQIATACKTFGFFNAINHGISDETVNDAVEVTWGFFEAPEAKEALKSGDLREPVRFGTMVESRGGHASGCGNFARDYLKLFASPLEDYIGSWPAHPPEFRSKMGKYTKEVKNLSLSLLEPMLENLKIENPSPLLQKVDSQGTHLIGVNHYHNRLQISDSSAQIGIPPHSDHTILTVLLQTSPGLHVLDPFDGQWKEAAFPSETTQVVDGPSKTNAGASSPPANVLQVIVGDQLEILSNGRYKANVHRVAQGTPGSESGNRGRVSVVSLLSFGFDEVVEPAAVVTADGEEVMKPLFKGGTLRDFLERAVTGVKQPFIETLRIVDD